MKKAYKVFGILFILIGISLIAYYLFTIIKDNKKDNDSVELYFEKQNEIIESTETTINSEESIEQTEQQELLYNYVGVLEIPSINFKRGFLNLDDKNNVVDKNIQVINTSQMPDVVNGNLIIAGHSGNGRIAFFKNLPKLSIGDKSYVYYNNKKYTYKLIEYYEVEKDGIIHLKEYTNKTLLTLITCKPNTDKQIIFINELVKVD